MKHYGDITKISGYDVPIVDIITGGSPCQDLSVAGKRAGLAGERSGLFMEQIRIIKEMHDACRRANVDIRPRYMVWENVPGAFSSNNGEDFRAVLEETAKVAEGNTCIPRFEGGRWPQSGCIMGTGWSIAWRVHDAQFWGVPQRRKRIALVADFRGTSAPEILFERKGVSGDSEPGEQEREDIAGDLGDGIEESGRVIGFHLTQDPVSSEELSYAVSCGSSTYGQCVNGVVYGIGGYDSEGMKSKNPHTGIYEAKTSRTLDNNGGNPACNQGGMAVVSTYQNTTGTLSPGAHAGSYNGQDAYNDMLVVDKVYALDRASFNQGQSAKFDISIKENVAQTIVSRGPGGVMVSANKRSGPSDTED